MVVKIVGWWQSMEETFSIEFFGVVRQSLEAAKTYTKNQGLMMISLYEFIAFSDFLILTKRHNIAL